MCSLFTAEGAGSGRCPLVRDPDYAHPPGNCCAVVGCVAAIHELSLSRQDVANAAMHLPYRGEHSVFERPNVAARAA